MMVKKGNPIEEIGKWKVIDGKSATEHVLKIKNLYRLTNIEIADILDLCEKTFRNKMIRHNWKKAEIYMISHME